MKKFYIISIAFFFSTSTFAQTYHDLSVSSFFEDWSTITAITANDDWSGVPSIRGFRGDLLTGSVGVDPQTLLAGDDPGVLDVNANQTDPNVFATGGVTEFHITNPVVALSGSGTADAPYLKIYLNTTGKTNITLSFDAIDIDGSVDNTAQQIAVHYRVGTTGVFTNLPSGYIADASTGSNLSGNTNSMSISLPVDAENVAQLEIRIMTTNAVGNDEWIGIDNISVISNPVLSVFFKSFNGLYKENTAQLNWSALITSSSTDYFTVEKSNDGENFTTLATVPANVNLDEYVYIDNNHTGVAFYRIAFVENGMKKYSAVLKIGTTLNRYLTIDRLFMNSDSKLSVTISSTEKSAAVVMIRDLVGKKIYHQSIIIQKGIQALSFNVPSFKRGVYTFSILTDKENNTRQWIK